MLKQAKKVESISRVYRNFSKGKIYFIDFSFKSDSVSWNFGDDIEERDKVYKNIQLNYTNFLVVDKPVSYTEFNKST